VAAHKKIKPPRHKGKDEGGRMKDDSREERRNTRDLSADDADVRR
jgi:hypothetical protein